MNRDQKIQKFIDETRKESEYLRNMRDEKDHEKCLRLVKKLEFLENNPLKYDRPISDVRLNYDLFHFHSDLVYYTKCPELSQFIERANERNTRIKFSVSDYRYVDRICPIIDFDENKLTYRIYNSVHDID